MKIRRAIKDDIPAVVDITFDAFIREPQWWTWQFPFWAQDVAYHRSGLQDRITGRIATPGIQDNIMYVAEVELEPGKPEIAAYATWNLAYDHKRKHGEDYQKHNPRE